MTSPMEGFMFDIKPREVSLVKRPANKREFLLTKNDGEEMDELLQAVLETQADNEDAVVESLKARGLDDSAIEAAKGVMRLISAYSDKFDGDAFKEIGKAVGFETGEETKGDTKPKITKTEKATLDPETRTKVESLEKAYDAYKSRIDKLEESLAQSESDKRVASFVEKVKDLDGLNSTPENVGTSLKEFADATSDEKADEMLQILRAASAAVKNAELFSEYGSSGVSVAGQSALEEVDRQAEAIAKSDNIDIIRAREKVFNSDKELQARYLDEVRNG